MRSTLAEMAHDLRASPWSGRREREIISLYAFGYLVRACKPRAFLHDPTQIAIEVVVRQIAEQMEISRKETAKPQVTKDIVLWPRPRMTGWNQAGKVSVRPSCIIEWKHNVVPSVDPRRWLLHFSRGAHDFVGFVVHTSLTGTDFAISCERVRLDRSSPFAIA